MRALVSLTLQRKLRTNMRRMQLLGYSPQPGCSGRPAGLVSGGSSPYFSLTLAEVGVRFMTYILSIYELFPTNISLALFSPMNYLSHP